MTEYSAYGAAQLAFMFYLRDDIGLSQIGAGSYYSARSTGLPLLTIEVAPPGREGSHVALSYLPYFGAKFIAGPMAGILLSSYAPEFGIGGTYMNYPDHQMIWWWVGGSAALTPIGLVALRRLYREAEERARKVAAEAAAAEMETAAVATAE